MPGGAARLALLLCVAGAFRPAVLPRTVRPRRTALRAADDDDAPTTTETPAKTFMDSMQSFFAPKPPTNTSATAQKAKADEEKTDAEVSEEQRRVAEAVVESAFVEASETDDAGRTQTLQKEALDDDVLKAFGIELEGEYKSETLRTISEVAVKAKIALEGAQVQFATEIERSKAVVLALVEYAKRKIKYESSRLLTAAEDVLKANVSLTDAALLLSEGINPFDAGSLKTLAPPDETPENLQLRAADARRRKEQSRKVLPTPSSLQDVAYEARRELTERRPGARIEEKLPGIGPALDKLAPRRLEQAAAQALSEPAEVVALPEPEPEPEPEPPKERERNLRPGVARSVDAAADAVAKCSEAWNLIDDSRANQLRYQLDAVATFLADDTLTFSENFMSDGSDVLRNRRLALAGAFADVVSIVTPEAAATFADALREVLALEELLKREAALDAALAEAGVSREERPLTAEDKELLAERQADADALQAAAEAKRAAEEEALRLEEEARQEEAERRAKADAEAQAEVEQRRAEEAARRAEEAAAALERAAEEKAARLQKEEAERLKAEEEKLARADAEVADVVAAEVAAAEAEVAAARAEVEAARKAVADEAPVVVEAVEPSVVEAEPEPETTETLSLDAILELTADDEDDDEVVVEEVVVGDVEVLDTTPFEVEVEEEEAVVVDETVVDDSGSVINGTSPVLDADGDAIAVEADTEAIAENATAGDVILRVLDLVLLLSERFFGSFLPDFVEVVASAADNAQKALADPLAESKSTSLLGGVKSTLPDEDEEAGRQRNVPKLDAPTNPDDPLSGLWSDSDDKPS